MDEYYLKQILEICQEYEEAVKSGEIRTTFHEEYEKASRFERICDLVKEWRDG